MTTHKDMSRRALLRVGLGAAAGVASGNLLAKSNLGAVKITPSQTAGPFFPSQNQADKDMDLTFIEGHSEHAEGERIVVSGQILDDEGEPITGALVDIWQANRHGRYHHENDPNRAPLDLNFQGWGQIKTDRQGHYRFKTIVPGPYPVNANWWRPPHIHFKVSKRGYYELTTQMYFAGHPLNTNDFLLQELAEPDRDELIVTFKDSSPDQESGAKYGHFNLVLRRVSSR